MVGKGSTFCFKLPFALSDKEASATSDHFIQRPLRFSSLENWPLSKASVKSGLLLHRRAHSLGVLLRGVKFSLPAHLAYDNEYPDGEGLFDPDSDGVLGNCTSTTVDESLRATLGVIQVGSGLFRQKAFSDKDLLCSKEHQISSDRGSRPAGMVSRKRDAGRPTSARAGGSKLPKSPRLESRVRNMSGLVTVCEASGSLLPNNSRLHDLSRAVEIPQKPTDKFILEKLRSATLATSEKQATTLSPSLQDQEVSPKGPISALKEDVVIDILDAKSERFSLGSDQHTESASGSSGSSVFTEISSLSSNSSDLVIKFAPNGANLEQDLSPGMGEMSQDAIQTCQKVIESQKRPPKVVVPPKGAPERQLKILLAEDNPINQKVATRQLQKYGHKVTIVGDGKQALETVQADHEMFDLVLMDVQVRIHIIDKS
jgi:CheY-like chemotaxis protein